MDMTIRWADKQNKTKIGNYREANCPCPPSSPPPPPLRLRACVLHRKEISIKDYFHSLNLSLTIQLESTQNCDIGDDIAAQGGSGRHEGPVRFFKWPDFYSYSPVKFLQLFILTLPPIY